MVSQSVKIPQQARLTSHPPIIDGQDDLQTLKRGDPECSTHRLPIRRNTGRSADWMAQPVGEQAEHLGFVGEGLKHRQLSTGSSGFRKRLAQHDRLSESRRRGEHHIPTPVLDRVDQAEQRFIVRGERDIRRKAVVEGISRQSPVSIPHVRVPPRAIGDRLGFPGSPIRPSHHIAFYHLDRIGWDLIFARTWRRSVSSRFYCPDSPQEGRLRLSPEEARHLTRVCRLGEGDRVEVFDGRGFASTARVVAVRLDCAELSLEGEPLLERRAPCSLTLATSVPKRDRFDWLIEKTTELGVDRLIPMITERSVVDPRGTKLDRLRRAIIEASKQCRRSRLMVLDEPMAWTTLVSTFPESLRVLADANGDPPSRWPPFSRGATIVLAVGPEGGLTSPELELADRFGWKTMQFSVNTLRIETAGLAGCAALFTHVLETEK